LFVLGIAHEFEERHFDGRKSCSTCLHLRDGRSCRSDFAA
jgi:hypothetical protein